MKRRSASAPAFVVGSAQRTTRSASIAALQASDLAALEASICSAMRTLALLAPPLLATGWCFGRVALNHAFTFSYGRSRVISESVGSFVNVARRVVNEFASTNERSPAWQNVQDGPEHYRGSLLCESVT